MSKPLAALALLVLTFLFAAPTAVAQRYHGHGHGHVHRGGLGYHSTGYRSIGVGGLGIGYRPYSYRAYYPGFSYGFYPSVNFGWPYYGSYYAYPTTYFTYPSAYVLGASPIYWGSGFNYAAPQTTIINLQNAAVPDAAVNDPNAVANAQIAPANANARVAARPIDVQFGKFAQLSDLSARLIGQSNELCLDLHVNYPQNPGFDDTYRAAYQIFDTANFVFANQDEHQEIARRVNEADAHFHQVQSDVKKFRRRNVRKIGGTNLQPKMIDVESTLHDLMRDVGVLGAHGAPPPAAAPPVVPPQNQEVAPPPGQQLPPPNPPRGN